MARDACPDFDTCAYRQAVAPLKVPTNPRFMWIMRYCMHESTACARNRLKASGHDVPRLLQPDGSSVS